MEGMIVMAYEAMIIFERFDMFDGTTTIAGDLNINSDARLKANIISLGSLLIQTFTN